MPQMTFDQAVQFGVSHLAAGRSAEAERVANEILQAFPTFPNALVLRALALTQLNRGPEAEASLRQAINLDPKNAAAHLHLGRLLLQSGRDEEGFASLRNAQALSQGNIDMLMAIADAFQSRNRHQESESILQNILAAAPHHMEANNLLGMTHRMRGNLSMALVYYQQALVAHPNNFAVLSNYGVALAESGRVREAITAHERSLTSDATHAVAWYNYGLALAVAQRTEEAIRAYNHALALDPHYFDAYVNLGNLHRLGGNLDEAERLLRKAITLRPQVAAVHTNLAAVLQGKGLTGPMLQSHARALELSSDHPQLHSNYVYCLHFQPGYDTPTIQAAHQEWNRRHGIPTRPLRKPHANDQSPDRRLRVGIVSAELREHVVGRNMIPWLREYNREALEIFCYSNTEAEDAVSAQFKSWTSHWHNIFYEKDPQVAGRIAHDQIDILLDLTLHMAGSRLALLALKPAPVQVTFAGYPGSTGLETIDYRLTDPHLDPPGLFDPYYSEQSIRLPHSFWCYEPPSQTIQPNDLPAAATGHITFGCFNNFYKVNEPIMELWARIMTQVPRSRLQLLAHQGNHRDRVKAFFQTRGITPDRVEFMPMLPRDQYLARYHTLDLSLDTLPYNGHTTSLDSLWMGVPVVTLVGNTVVGRAGYSQLTNLNLPELIATSAEEYVAKAVALAHDLPRLSAYRRTLRAKMEASPLMDAKGFANAIETALRQMWRTWCRAPLTTGEPAT